MNFEEILSLCFVLIPLIVVYLLILPFYRRAKRDRARYRFFAVRDELLRLVEEGKISEEDPLFCDLYDGLNKVVNNTHKLTFSNAVKAAQTIFADKRGKRRIDQLTERINNANDDVKNVYQHYFQAFEEVLKMNGLYRSLVWAVACRGVSVIAKNLTNFILKLFPAVQSAWQFHNDVLFITNQNNKNFSQN